MKDLLMLLIAVPVIGSFTIGAWVIFFWCIQMVVEAVQDLRRRQ